MQLNARHATTKTIESRVVVVNFFCSMHASSRDDKDMKDLHTRNVKSVLRLKPMHAIIQLKKTYYSCDIAIVEDSHGKPLE